jgi:magnesium chelatase family protein
MEGPPGTGKTMLARRLPSILPPLTRAEALEVTRIHSVAGIHHGGGLVRHRPFRAPHHTISASGLAGGGSVPAPGEVTLAHRGVLFLDELSEFPRSSLEALRQPLEDGRVGVVRGQHAVVFPSRFMLVAATNPCPCGFAGAGRSARPCRCSDADVERHRRRLSGPLLDRIDLLVGVQRPSPEELAGGPLTTSADARERVVEARARQAQRLAAVEATCNADMDNATLRDALQLSSSARDALLDAYRGGQLSARGHHRALRVARTIADLHGSDTVERAHVMETLALRQHGPAEVLAA